MKRRKRVITKARKKEKNTKRGTGDVHNISTPSLREALPVIQCQDVMDVSYFLVFEFRGFSSVSCFRD